MSYDDLLARESYNQSQFHESGYSDIHGATLIESQLYDQADVAQYGDFTSPGVNIAASNSKLNAPGNLQFQPLKSDSKMDYGRSNNGTQNYFSKRTEPETYNFSNDLPQ